VSSRPNPDSEVRVTDKILLNEAPAADVPEGQRVRLHRYNVFVRDPRDGKLRRAQVTIEMVLKLMPKDGDPFGGGPAGPPPA
jgi:hypothetical protein